MNHAPTPAAQTSNRLVVIIVVVVLLAFGFIGVALVGLGAISALGMRKYVGQAKAAEGQTGAMILARGVVTCASVERVEAGDAAAPGLPPTSKPVPGSLSDVSAKRYLSAPGDWADPAFTCAHFSMTTPQSFQYQWVASGPRAGVARAVADLDGDGKPDHVIEVDVTCPEGGGGCEAGRPREVR